MTIRIGVQFGWNGKASAYQNLTAQQSRLSSYVSSAQNAMNSLGSLLTSAAQNQISGMSQIAAQKAVTRLQAQIKAANTLRDQRIASMQSNLQATTSVYNSSSTGTVVNTTA